MHVFKTEQLVFFTLAPGQQHAATGHGFKILDHELVHADVSTDENLDAIECFEVFRTRFSASHQHAGTLRERLKHRLALGVLGAFQAAQKTDGDIPLSASIAQHLLVVTLGDEDCVDAFSEHFAGNHGARHQRAAAR